MPRYRVYRDDDLERAVGEFVGWAAVMGGMGLSALIKVLRGKPSMYTPISPDDPTQEQPLDRLMKGLGKLDFSKAKMPKFNLGDGKPSVSWPEEDRPVLQSPEEAGLIPVVAQPTRQQRTYRIAVPQGDPNPQAGIEMVRTLLTSHPRLTFAVVAEHGATAWQVTDPLGDYREQIITDHIRTYAPRAQVTVTQGEDQEREYPFYRQLLLFGLTNEFAAPLPFVDLLKDRDPLRAITRRMDLLRDDLEERIVYALQVRVPTREGLFRAGQRLLGGTVKPSLGIYRPNENDPIAGLDQDLLNRKLAGPLFHCFLTVTVESLNNSRLDELVQVASDLNAYTLTGHNGVASVLGQAPLRKEVPSPADAAVPWLDSLLAAMVERGTREWREALMVLCPGEIAALWHLPDATFEGNRIAWAKPPVPAEVTGEQGDRVCLGDAESSRPLHPGLPGSGRPGRPPHDYRQDRRRQKHPHASSDPPGHRRRPRRGRD